jgi:aldehyde dehydrogenase (NAD+)
VAQRTAEATKVGDPFADGTTIGPLSSRAQFDKVQRLIEKGIEEGARLVAGGLGCPGGLTKGYFVKPTVFADVRNDMTIAREEIFGPVLCIIPIRRRSDAARIADDTPYGLSGFVTSGSIERAGRAAKRIRSGNVHINGAQVDFGGLFWRLQAVGQWQRMGRSRARGIP